MQPSLDLRRFVAMTLAVTLTLLGIPMSVSAADEPVSPPRVLMLDGLPLAELLAGNVSARGAVVLAGLLGQATGQISGVALDGGGQPLVSHTVHLTRVFTTADNLAASTDMGTEATDAQGRFAFNGLQASDYRLDVLGHDDVLAAASVSLDDGAMQATAVTVSEPTQDQDPGSGMSTTKKVGIGAAIGAAGGAAVGFALGETVCQNEGGVRCDGRAQGEYAGVFALIGLGVGAAIAAIMSK